MPVPALEDLIIIAQQAGKILKQRFGKSNNIQHKSLIDLVTDADHETEVFILNEITKRFPGHYILAEESGVSDGNHESSWFIDPLDGTVNYAHNIPIFTVSLAYASHGVTQLGVVYAPMLGELFSAELGKGSHLNGDKLHVSKAVDLDHALLVTGFPYNIRTNPTNLEYYRRFALRSQGVRRLGSAALDLCYVGAGRFEGYWEVEINPWDIAAGVLIAQEAGAVVTSMDGRSVSYQPPITVLAAAPAIHQQMLAVLKE